MPVSKYGSCSVWEAAVGSPQMGLVRENAGLEFPEILLCKVDPGELGNAPPRDAVTIVPDPIAGLCPVGWGGRALDSLLCDCA